MDLLKYKTLPTALVYSVCTFSTSNILANNLDDPTSHFGPPAVSVTDRMGVSMTSGVMSRTVADVTIGGERGLTHSISTSGGTLSIERPQNRGFRDSFFGSINGGERTMNTSDLSDDIDILTVSDGRETVIFKINGSPGSHTFTELRGGAASTRNKLTQSSSSLAVWTKADGTKVNFYTYGWLTRNYGTKARMTSIEHPNGFSIHIDYGSQYKITSVSTNTGYQLKYIFQDDNRSITSSQQNYINTTTFGEPYHHSSLLWSREVPKYIVALNNAEATCDLTSTTCSYASHWPKATYEWPAGMPRVAFLPDPVDFTVKDAENRSTKFTMRGFDIAVPYGGYASGYLFDILPNERAVSRITKLTPPSGKAIEYTYENSPELVYSDVGHIYIQIDGFVRHSILNRAKRGNDELDYFFDINNGQGDIAIYRSSGFQSMQGLHFNQATESLSHFHNWDMYVGYTQANEISIVDNYLDGTRIEYDYDSRGNITKVTQVGSTSNLVSSATYATSCYSTNEKYCNKPKTTTDPNGNVTNYTYHAASGNIETVTLPANKHGVRAKTTYSYQQYTASHNGSYSSPIWLLSQKSTCASAQTCPVSEQIITTYEYEPNNLHLVGEAVSADGQTLRTCYEYDRYGNQVTVMPPKDNINKSTCIN